MKIEFGDNVFGSIIVTCAAVVLSLLVVHGMSCAKVSNARDAQVKLKAIETRATVTYSGEIISK